MTGKEYIPGIFEGGCQALKVILPLLADVVVHRVLPEGEITRHHPREVLGSV